MDVVSLFAHRFSTFGGQLGRRIFVTFPDCQSAEKSEKNARLKMLKRRPLLAHGCVCVRVREGPARGERDGPERDSPAWRHTPLVASCLCVADI